MRNIITTIIFLLITATAFSQRFMHGIGIGILWSQGSNKSASVGLTYSPKIIFFETSNYSFSVGMPINLGFTGIGSVDYKPESEPHIPIIANINFGRGSTKTNHKMIGYFVGGGFAFHHGHFEFTNNTNSYSFQDDRIIDAFGPTVNAGIRIGTGRHNKKNIEINLSYFKAINSYKPYLFGLGCQFNF